MAQISLRNILFVSTFARLKRFCRHPKHRNRFSEYKIRGIRRTVLQLQVKNDFLLVTTVPKELRETFSTFSG